MTKDTVYEMVTERILAALDAGTAPWRKPWNTATAPRNIEGYTYRGVNVFLLADTGYTSPFWMTFKQAGKRGGRIKKGEKGTVIVFWKRLMVTEKDETTGETVRKVIPMLRYYRVWNVEQTEGVRLPKAVADWQPPQDAPSDTFAAADAIVDGYPDAPTVSLTGASAYYQPATDRIVVPPIAAYDEPAEFYSTLFHEFGHSTGHSKRLARKTLTESDGFGGHVYGREELTAEMTAAFLCAEAGIEVTMDNSAAYLASWIRTIKADPRAVVVAAGAAQRAADLVLGRPAFGEEAVPAVVAA